MIHPQIRHTMGNMHMKNCPASLVIRAIKSKPHYHFTISRTARIKKKKKTVIYAEKDVEKQEPSYIAMEMCKWHSHFGK